MQTLGKFSNYWDDIMIYSTVVRQHCDFQFERNKFSKAHLNFSSNKYVDLSCSDVTCPTSHFWTQVRRPKQQKTDVSQMQIVLRAIQANIKSAITQLDHSTMCLNSLDSFSLKTSTHFYVFITSPHMSHVKEGEGKVQQSKAPKTTHAAMATNLKGSVYLHVY